MKFQGRRRSKNVDDRRGRSSTVRRGAVGGGIGAIVMLAVLFLVGGQNAVVENLGMLTGGGQPAAVENNYQESELDAALSELASVTLADTEDVWKAIFKDMGRTYVEPTMVLYSGETDGGACGTASASIGPFYCPPDQKLYLDLDFYTELKNKFGATGDFAFAYVIAHEVGHHVQTLLGVSDQMNNIRRQVSEKEYNKYSVAFELQADYLAGVYARYAKEMGYLENGDIKEALEAAYAVGDDNIQKRARGYAVPDSFTHGTSEQRMQWFNLGYETGNLDNWDTFKVLIQN